ncbi:MAG: 50S ribosomal protein L17 [Bacillota bacterium]|nr:50S ribosomal protein L17 [Bacillota bacterium]
MAYAKLGRRTGHRNAMLRSLSTALFEHEQIETTETRAKEVARIADRMVTLAKRGDLHARRQALAYLTREDVVKKLFDTIGPRYAGRNGGYTRITRLGPRRGDAAPMALVELI